MSTPRTYEQGTIDACNAILDYLHRTGDTAIAHRVLAAWESGDIRKRRPLDPPHAADTELSPSVHP